MEKNSSEETPNIRQMLKIMLKIGYSLCKMVSLGQKLKMPKMRKPFYKNNTVVLCKKKLLEKALNIREIRRYLKFSLFQKL